MNATPTGSIGEWLERAYQEGCPPPEAYLPEELAALDAAARSRLEEHAESCPACFAERELASSFELPGNLSASERAEVRQIARRLERRPAYAKGGSGLGWLPSWSDLLRSPALQLAAAAVLAVGIGVGLYDSGPPRLGEGPGEEVMRSSTLELREPVGEIGGAPETLVWEPVEGAATYVVTVRGVDERELWRRETASSSIAADPALTAQLHAAVSYVWRVEAFDASGARIAWSPATTFTLRPGD
jgi:hypothetical protein